MKKKVLLLIVVAIIAIPLIYLALVYNSLPPIVAIHFGVEGKPNGYGGKSTLIFVVLLLSVVSLGVYLLLTNIQKIDPKRAANQSKETMQKMAFAIIVLFAALNIAIIYAAINNSLSFNNMILPLLGLFFSYLGNLMYSVKPNYFVGIRTPWTLEDEETWRKTHQLAGKMWFPGGILITVLTLATPAKFGIIIMVTITAAITIIPVVYSYRYFQLHKKTGRKL